jgi:hypothetical protein
MRAGGLEHIGLYRCRITRNARGGMVRPLSASIWLAPRTHFAHFWC